MRKLTKALALILSLALLLTFPVGASAAAPDPVPDPTTDVLIDEDRTGSLTIYKVDLTNAEKDGVWDSSYVSTGIYDQDVYDTLIGATRAGDTDNSSDLGNGEQSFGYAIAGVEFTYLRIADIVQFTESTNDGSTSNHVEVLYGIDKTKGADFLKVLGLDGGAKQYANAANTDKLDGTKYYYYQSDVLIDALNAALESNATTTKNALEAYVKANGGTAMPLTDAYGKTSAENLELGLYVCVETKVPEMVVSSCNPFLLSLPMTNVSGGNSEDGGTYWIYDVTTFPKNLTGIPTLEKLLKESAADTGKNQGTKELTDGYAHTGTASDGDIIDYLITSTLPSITSASTYLSEYSFIDTLSKGITYLKNDVVLSFYTDAACKNLVATWTEADGKFAVSYNTTTAGESVMTISMTEKGLAEINTSKDVYSGANMVNSGYSDCTVKITYQAQMNSDASVIYGDAGNPNEVALVWRRTSSNYYDTLVDDAHVFTYGIELTKLFSDGQGNFDKVEFILFNETDGYEIQCSYYTDKIMSNREWTMAGIFADEGITGTSTEKRDDFKRMIRKCRQGKIDLILTKSISRFARNTLDTIHYTRILRAMGIGVYFEKENINTLDMDSEMLITMLGAFAQAESESISRNVAWGKRQALKEGKVYVNFKRLYAYNLDKNGEPAIDWEKGAVVKFIYEQYLGGDSLRQIKAKLDDEGFLNPAGEPGWQTSTIKAILTNEKYCGDALGQKTFKEDVIGGKTIKNTGQLPQVLIQNNHPAIVRRETFYQVQEEMKRRSAARSPSMKSSTGRTSYASKYALSERLVCGECGTLYRRCTWNIRGKKKIVWRCVSRLDYGTKYCKESPTMEESALQEAIMEAINSLMDSKEGLTRQISEATILDIRPTENRSLTMGEVKRRLRELTAELDALLEKEDSAEDDSKRYQQIHEEMGMLRKQQEEIAAQLRNNTAAQERIKKTSATLDQMDHHMKGWSEDDIRQLVHTVKVVSADHIQVILKDGSTVEQEVRKQ